MHTGIIPGQGLWTVQYGSADGQYARTASLSGYNGIYAHIYGLYTGGDSPTVPGLENVPGAFTFRKPLNQVPWVLKLCYNSFTQCIGCIKKRGKLCRD